MLIIKEEHEKRFQEIVKASIEGNNFIGEHGLWSQLKYLGDYGHSFDKRTRLLPDLDGFNIVWERLVPTYNNEGYTWQVYMNGGLVLHTSDNRWSVHT